MGEKRNDSSRKPKKSRPVEFGKDSREIYLLEDGAPRYELRIDREGRWFHEGVEIVREDIRNLFSRNLARCDDGGYCVRIGADESPVVVEDAPFVVVRVTEEPRSSGPRGGLTLLLNDGGLEPFDARTLEFRDANVPYCRVRADLEARFLRAAYYQLAKFIRHDEAGDTYYLELGGERIEIEIP